MPLTLVRESNEPNSKDSISDNDEFQPESTHKTLIANTTALQALMQCYSDSDDEVPLKVPKFDGNNASVSETTSDLALDTNFVKQKYPQPQHEAIEGDVKKTLTSLVDRVHARLQNEQRKQSGRKQPPPRPVSQRKLSLLEKLLAKDIRHERNILLQCVDYVIQMNFFDGQSFEI